MNEKIEVPTMKVPPLKKICMTIGQLPASYVESMSYYEMLVWFVHYLRDDIIPVVNANGEATKELQELYVELQDYVNNYFDNLDVQEEIDNKLDEMVEEGTLQEIIAEYLNSKAIFGYDNVASMKLATNLIDGSYAKTLGFYSKNDGGMATYKIREVTNDDVVDEMSIISLYDDNLIAELIYSNNIINVKQIGAKGDNTQDDTTFIQVAINKAFNNNLIVYIPCGKYKITSTLHLYNNTELKGSNGGNPWTTYNSQSIINCVLPENTNAIVEDTNNANVYIRNLTFVCDSCRVNQNNTLEPKTLKYIKTTTTSNVNCLYLTNAKNGSVIENVNILGFSGTGITGMGDSTINNIYITHCGFGIDMSPDVILSNFRIQFCEYGINLANAVRVTNGRIEEISKHAIYINKQSIYAIVDNVILDQIGYAGLAVYATLRSCDLKIENRRCCSYYSSYTINDIMSDENLIYPACAKIYVDSTATFDENNITDNTKQTMYIIDNNQTSVTPLLIYSNTANLYNFNFYNNSTIYNNNSITLSSIDDLTTYAEEHYIIANTTNGFMYIKNSTNNIFMQLYKNKCLCYNNINVRTSSYTYDLPIGSLMYVPSNTSLYLVKQLPLWPLTNQVKLGPDS